MDEIAGGPVKRRLRQGLSELLDLGFELTHTFGVVSSVYFSGQIGYFVDEEKQYITEPLVRLDVM